MKYLMRNLEESIVSGLDSLLGYPREKRKFKKAHGYELNLRNPQSFNEKICHKKISDRNPLIPITADKFRVRQYIEEALGADTAQNILIPLINSFDHEDEINASDIPENAVLKSNHGSGNNLIIRNGLKATQQEIRNMVKTWLYEPYGQRNHEWAYTQMPRKILLETLLVDSNDKIPADYKLHMFHGKCELIKVDSDRHENFTSTLYDGNWKFLNVKWRRKIGEPKPKPALLDDMLKIAEELSKPFDFVRVDFYIVNNRIFFSEMTHYPSRGRGRFEPTSFDFELGQKW